jgi:hypothetical protein
MRLLSSPPTGPGCCRFKRQTDSGFRAFTFTAQKSDDGSTAGEMQLVNLFTGNVVHARLDCLNIVGSTATLSGTVTYSNDPIFETFSAVVFSVTDNGEGTNALPDTISFADFDVPSPEFTCMTAFLPPNLPIIAGNVRVSG